MGKAVHLSAQLFLYITLFLQMEWDGGDNDIFSQY